MVLYFHKLNPFSPKKTQKQKLLTWQMWIKVLIASVPAAVVGLLFNDYLDAIFYKPLPVAVMLIVYGVLFIVVENRNKHVRPKVTKISELSVRCWSGSACSRCWHSSPEHPDPALLLWAPYDRDIEGRGGRVHLLPCHSGHVRRKLLKLIGFGLSFTAKEAGLLILGCVVSFGVSVLAIKFLMGYIKNHDFKVFGYYRIVLGAIIIIAAIVQMIIA